MWKPCSISWGAAGADADELRSRTGGNPLYLREVAGRRSDVPLPAELSDLLLAPIEALGPNQSDTLSLLALAGRDAPPAVIAAGAGRPVTEVVGHLEGPLAADLLRTDGQGALWFRHALLGDAARGRLDDDERRALDRRLARAWLEVGDRRLPSRSASARHQLAAMPASGLDPAALAATLVELTAEQIEAGLAPEAEQLLAAAEVAFARYEPGAVVDRARLALALGDTRWALGDRWLAAKTYQQADALLEVGRRAGGSPPPGRGPHLGLSLRRPVPRRPGPGPAPDPGRAGAAAG